MFIFNNNNFGQDSLNLRTQRLLALKTYIEAWQAALSIPAELVAPALSAYDLWVAALGKSTVSMGQAEEAHQDMQEADETTFDYVRGRPFAPKNHLWDQAIAHWKTLPTDPDATFDKEIDIDCRIITPQISWGNSPQHETGIDGVVPDPAIETDANQRKSIEQALEYMDLNWQHL